MDVVPTPSLPTHTSNSPLSTSGTFMSPIPEQLACVLNETFSQNGFVFCEVNQSPQPSGLSASPYLPTPAPNPPIQDDNQSFTMNQNPFPPSQSHSFSFALQQLLDNLEPDEVIQITIGCDPIESEVGVAQEDEENRLTRSMNSTPHSFSFALQQLGDNLEPDEVIQITIGCDPIESEVDVAQEDEENRLTRSMNSTPISNDAIHDSYTPSPCHTSCSLDTGNSSTTILSSPDEHQMVQDYSSTNLATPSNTHTSNH
ncbi:hypothetical protein EV424DRAFT_1543984 [Suillus variegatus]|nr:hypothetical protein EV424DRAFT_1543984 [Suillus variegatus]